MSRPSEAQYFLEYGTSEEKALAMVKEINRLTGGEVSFEEMAGWSGDQILAEFRNVSGYAVPVTEREVLLIALAVASPYIAHLAYMAIVDVIAMMSGTSGADVVSQVPRDVRGDVYGRWDTLRNTRSASSNLRNMPYWQRGMLWAMGSSIIYQLTNRGFDLIEGELNKGGREEDTLEFLGKQSDAKLTEMGFSESDIAIIRSQYNAMVAGVLGTSGVPSGVVEAVGADVSVDEWWLKKGFRSQEEYLDYMEGLRFEDEDVEDEEAVDDFQLDFDEVMSLYLTEDTEGLEYPVELWEEDLMVMPEKAYDTFGEGDMARDDKKIYSEREIRDGSADMSYGRGRGCISYGRIYLFWNCGGRPSGSGWFYHRRLRKYVKRKNRSYGGYRRY